VQRVKGRDIATGVVLGAATGLSALFLYLSATSSAATGADAVDPLRINLHGEPSTLPRWRYSVVCLPPLPFIARPLLLSSLSVEWPRRGRRVRVVGLLFMVTLAVSVGLSAIVIGSILSTALLIGPPASALKVGQSILVRRGHRRGTRIGATWAGIVFAYDSYYWIPSHRGLPVSFFVVAFVVVEFAFFSVVHRRPSGSPRVGDRGFVAPRRGRSGTDDVLELHDERLVERDHRGHVGWRRRFLRLAARAAPSRPTRYPTGPSPERRAPTSSGLNPLFG